MYERRTPNLTKHRTTTASTIKSSTPIKQEIRQRTGRAPLTTTTNQEQRIDEHKEIQRRIAARAATAMAQIRRRQPRSYMLWGDNRKAVIKRYPDGAQEIMVPQTLTPEQEQYEFPPRSRLLKKLATSTAERHRLSSLQYNISAPPTVLPLPSSLSSLSYSHQARPIVKTNATNPRPLSTVELDQGALTEWFSGKQQHTAKDKAVMDWMTDVERSTSLVKKSNGSTIEKHLSFNPKKSSTSTKQATQNMHDINLHFKSEAGKLLSSGSCCLKSYNHLSPPSEDTKKHYVRLQRLRKHSNKPRRMTNSSRYQPYASVSSSSLPNHQRRENELLTSSTFTTTVPVPSHRHYPQAPESTIPRASPLSSSSSSKSGMVQLAQMFHKTLQDQQARAHKRMQQLESLLEEERQKRQNIQRTQQRTMSQLDIFMKKYQEQRRIPPSPILSTTTTTTTTTFSSSSPSPVSPAWASMLSSHSSSSSSLSRKNDQINLHKWAERITQLETRMLNETKTRQTLQQTVASTVQWMDGLKTSLSTQALEHSLSQHQLEKRINEALNRLSKLTQQRKNG